MEKSFNDLNLEDKGVIRGYYKRTSPDTLPADRLSKKEVQEHLSNLYGVTERTIRNWASKLECDPAAKKSSPAKVLIFDIETAPIKGYFWSRFQKVVPANMIEEDWFMLSWSAKWLFDDEVFSMVCTPEEAINCDDSRITKGMWKALDEADIIIAHNLNKFDEKRVNTRFIKYRLNLPSPYKTIDTLLHARKKFAMTSNRLDDLAAFFGVEGKIKTEERIQVKCKEGDAKALKDLQVYCDQDVRVLEDVYLIMRPYIQPHPNMGLYVLEDQQTCATCGSDALEFCGDYHTTVNTYTAYRCQECGSYSRSRKASLSAKDREGITSSVPK